MAMMALARISRWALLFGFTEAFWLCRRCIMGRLALGFLALTVN